jgi:hypothetical protein
MNLIPENVHASDGGLGGGHFIDTDINKGIVSFAFLPFIFNYK